jgi:hypothetical protein
MSELPLIREEFGFQRTECGCACCQVHCRHIPGGLAPADLTRLCPPGRDVFAWAEQQLRALTGRPVPTLVPARQPDGACHWFRDGHCLVHDRAPYGCAFFDSHMGPDEVDRRESATVRARREDAAAEGLYFRVWLHLQRHGLVSPAGDRAAVLAELVWLRRRAERFRRRAREG